MLLRPTIAVAALIAFVGSAEAAPKGSKGPGPKVTKTSGAPKAPKATAPKGGPKTTTATTKAAKAARSTTSSGLWAPEIDFTAGKVGEKLSKNSALWLPTLAGEPRSASACR